MAEKNQKLERPERNSQTKQRNLARLKRRREEHEERMEARSKLSPQEQLKRLDWRLGKNHGAKKERLRLQKQIESVAGHLTT